MLQKILQIKENKNIAKNVYKMVLEGDIEEHRPGQFVNIKMPGMYLRRPVSVCDFEGAKGELTLCYKIVGEGTKLLAALKEGVNLDVLTCLGNGYDLAPAVSEAHETQKGVLLIGGGMGTAPLFLLAKKLVQSGIYPQVLLGFNSADEIFYRDEFESLGLSVTAATADGSFGVRGFVTDALPDDYGYFYACGPLAMMKAVNAAAKTSGQFSLEERMGCGFGACMGCSLKVKDLSAAHGAEDPSDIINKEKSSARESFESGCVSCSCRKESSAAEGPESDCAFSSDDAQNIVYKRICKEGPVFKREEIIWED